jgi:hypothetical protein
MGCQTTGNGQELLVWVCGWLSDDRRNATGHASASAFSTAYWVTVGNPMFKFGGISIATGEFFFTECFLVSSYAAEKVWFLSFKFTRLK